MELLLAAALVAYVITKMVTTHRVDHEYAKKGMTPPRLQAKLDRIAAGSTERPPARPGASGYLRELWHDAWDDATDRHKRIRAAKKAGDHPTVRQRIAGWWRWAKTPVGDPADKPADRPAVSPEPAVASPTGLPDGTWTLDRNGQRVPLAPSAEPPTEPVAPPVAPTPTPASGPGTATDPLNLQPRIDTDGPLNDDQDTTDPAGGNTMTDSAPTPAAATPSGEATGIVSGVAQAQALHLATIAFKERVAGEIGALLRAVETLAASAAQMEMPPPVTSRIDQAQESLAALSAAVTGTAEEVGAAMKAVETEWAKHLAVVEQSAALGGLATNTAYAGE